MYLTWCLETTVIDIVTLSGAKMWFWLSPAPYQACLPEKCCFVLCTQFSHPQSSESHFTRIHFQGWSQNAIMVINLLQIIDYIVEHQNNKVEILYKRMPEDINIMRIDRTSQYMRKWNCTWRTNAQL